jgi:predicted transcriptional regulator
MNVILSIRPKYCNAIASGLKKYEFRRRVFGRKVNSVYIYSTAPMKKIVAKFSVRSIIEDNPKALWQNFGDSSGLNETEFFAYFDGAEKGFAIEIFKVESFKPVDPKILIPNFCPPQNYCYLNEGLVQAMEQIDFLRRGGNSWSPKSTL